jgi:arsenite methyltransferase
MAMTCPAGFDTERLGELVRAEYDRLAREPAGSFHFHRGPEYASRMLGYDPEELASIPAESTAAFSGVGNPQRIGRMLPGEAILDVGCGAGMDLILAARRIGRAGRAIGVDITPSMIELAKRSALKAGLWETIEVLRGSAEHMPVESRSIDVVISNGALNLSPDKSSAFHEIYRVLKPGGRLHLADIVLQRELSLAARSAIDLWVARIGGALPEAELFEVTAQTGFIEAGILQRFDCYEATPGKSTPSTDLFLWSVNFFARKPRRPVSTGSRASARITR